MVPAGEDKSHRTGAQCAGYFSINHRSRERTISQTKKSKIHTAVCRSSHRCQDSTLIGRPNGKPLYDWLRGSQASQLHSQCWDPSAGRRSPCVGTFGKWTPILADRFDEVTTGRMKVKYLYFFSCYSSTADRNRTSSDAGVASLMVWFLSGLQSSSRTIDGHYGVGTSHLCLSWAFS